jgi:internalin A
MTRVENDSVLDGLGPLGLQRTGSRWGRPHGVMGLLLGMLLFLAMSARSAAPADSTSPAPTSVGPVFAYVHQGNVYTVSTPGRGFPKSSRPVEQAVLLWQGPLLAAECSPARKFPLPVRPPWGERNLFRWRVCFDSFWGTGDGAELIIGLDRIRLSCLPNTGKLHPDSFGLLPVWELAHRNQIDYGVPPEFATRDAWFDFLIGEDGDVQTLVAWRGHLRAWRGKLRLKGPAEEHGIRWDDGRKIKPLDAGVPNLDDLELAYHDFQPVLSAHTLLREPFHAFQDEKYFYLVTASGQLHACPRRGGGQRSRAVWEECSRPIRAVVCDSATGSAWAFTAAAGAEAPAVWFRLASRVRPVTYEPTPAMTVNDDDPLPAMLAYARILQARREIEAGRPEASRRTRRQAPFARCLEWRRFGGWGITPRLIPARQRVVDAEARDWTDPEAPRPDPAEEEAIKAVCQWGGTGIEPLREPGEPVKPVEALTCYAPSKDLTEAELKHLAAFKHLRTLRLHNAVTDDGLKALASLTHLQTLDLGQNNYVTDAGLEHLAPLKGLLNLGLDRTGVTDAGLTALSAMEKLESLDLGGNRVTDAGLKLLAGVPNLRSLNLNCTGVTGRGLKDLAALKHLQTLVFHRARVTDEGLKDLPSLAQLRTLDLSDTNFTGNVTDAALKSVAALAHLESLDLGETHVTDAGLKHLAALKQLRRLNLRKTRTTDAGLRDLSGLKQLQSLNLAATGLTDWGLEAVAEHEGLGELDLSETQLTDYGLKAVASLKALRSLDLAGTTITDAGLKELRGLKHLESLNLEETAVTNAGLKELAGLKHLENLNVVKTKVTKEGVQFLYRLPPDGRYIKTEKYN